MTQLDAGQQWKSIKSLATDISDAAHNSDWKAVSKIRSEFQIALEQFFDQEVPEDLLEEVSASLPEFIAHQQIIIQSAHQALDEITQELKSFKAGNKASRAYQRN